MATIRKISENTYQIAVSLGYKDKKQSREYYTVKVPEKIKTDAQLALWKEQIKEEYEDKRKRKGINIHKSVKFADYVKPYLETVQQTKSPNTYSQYKSVIEHRLVPYFGHMYLEAIDSRMIQDYVNELYRKNERCDHRDGGIKNSTVKKIFTVLRSIMSYAYRSGQIDVNPTSDRKIMLRHECVSEVAIFTENEIDIIFHELNRNYNNDDLNKLKYYVFFTLAFETGCRRGELVGLSWDDINWEQNSVCIKKSVCAPASAKKIIIKTTKNHKYRLLPLSEYTINLLKRYKSIQESYIFKVGDYWKGENWIFTQENGTIMYPTTPSQWFSRFLAQIGVPHKSCMHYVTLRHLLC